MVSEKFTVELKAPDIEPYRKSNIGVEFVTTFDSGKSGPHVMINAVTHGNEICGAIALDRLLKDGIRPVNGKLTLAFVNHLAYSTFDPSAPSLSRFIDEDFNRVWVEDRLDGLEKTSELQRARELRPIFDEVDLLLDIHSMGTFSQPLMICNGLPKEREFVTKVNFPAHIMCGSGHVVGKRLIEYTPDSMPEKMNEMTDKTKSRIIFNMSILDYLVSLLTINSFTLRSSAVTTVSSSEPYFKDPPVFGTTSFRAATRPPMVTTSGTALSSGITF